MTFYLPLLAQQQWVIKNGENKKISPPHTPPSSQAPLLTHLPPHTSLLTSSPPHTPPSSQAPLLTHLPPHTPPILIHLPSPNRKGKRVASHDTTRSSCLHLMGSEALRCIYHLSANLCTCSRDQVRSVFFGGGGGGGGGGGVFTS